MHAMALSRHLTVTLDFSVLPSILLKCTTHQTFELIEVAGWGVKPERAHPPNSASRIRQTGGRSSGHVLLMTHNYDGQRFF